MGALFGLAFAAARFPAKPRPAPAARWLILQKARRHTTRVLRLLAGARFQVLFHSPPGVLFTFPSRYSCAIGRRVVFRLGWWSTQLRTGFPVPGPTRGLEPSPRPGFAYGALTRCGRPSHAVPLPRRGRRRGRQSPGVQPRNPGGANAAARTRSPVWPSAPFARRYSGHLAIDFSSSGYLDVSVPRVGLPEAMRSPRGWRDSSRRVPPFGHPGIEGRVRLPRDYRGLPRPSSPPCAKASAVRPAYLARARRGADRARPPTWSCLRDLIYRYMYRGSRIPAPGGAG